MLLSSLSNAHENGLNSGRRKTRDVVNQQIRFAAESESEAGTKRADSEAIRKCFPAEVALLESQVDNLKDYVIFKLES